jgi:hypothetical protein
VGPGVSGPTAQWGCRGEVEVEVGTSGVYGVRYDTFSDSCSAGALY